MLSSPTPAQFTPSAEALAPGWRRASGAATPGLTMSSELGSASARGDVSRADALPALQPRDATAASARAPGLQQQLGRLQQGLDYLDRLGQSLQQLKRGLSQSLAQSGSSPSEGLQQQARQLGMLWQQRSEQAGGRIDAQLQAAPEGQEARQRFKLRGLDLAVLAQGGRETLQLQLPAGVAGERAMRLAVTLDGEGTPAQLEALARALSPAGLSVQQQGGELLFSVAESQWPALREGLSLRGEGRRFPSGQPLRAQLEPAAEALQPQRWDLQQAAGQRQALGQVLQAQPRLAQAREALDAQLRDQAPAASELTDAQARALAADWRLALSGADYAQLGEVLPALRGLHTQRVQQLLA